jgi:hypothetical protein
MAYHAGVPIDPAPQQDPGRVRNRAFFYKMYGDCRAGVSFPKWVDSSDPTFAIVSAG